MEFDRILFVFVDGWYFHLKSYRGQRHCSLVPLMLSSSVFSPFRNFPLSLLSYLTLVPSFLSSFLPTFLPSFPLSFLFSFLPYFLSFPYFCFIIFIFLSFPSLPSSSVLSCPVLSCHLFLYNRILSNIYHIAFPIISESFILSTDRKSVV